MGSSVYPGETIQSFRAAALLIFTWHFVTVIYMCSGIRLPRHSTLRLINREVFVRGSQCVHIPEYILPRQRSRKRFEFF